MKNKKGLELAISTIILMILGIAVLIGLIAILVMGWDNFKTQIGAILGSEISQARKSCEVQCELENSYDYCCEIKDAGVSCQDDLLKGNCVLDCSEVIC